MSIVREEKRLSKRKTLSSFRNGQLSFNLTIGAEEGWTVEFNQVTQVTEKKSTTRARQGSETTRLHFSFKI